MSYSLGIDIGSTKVAVAIVDTESGRTLDAVSILHGADSSTDPLYSEQDPIQLLDAIDVAVKGLPFDLRQTVSSIGVCGQMHGVVLWEDDTDEKSQLITWQDRRAADTAFMSLMRSVSGQENIYPGYGVVTLSWLAKYREDWLSQYTHSGTIMDFFVSSICDLDTAVIDPTNAASWGFFNHDTLSWQDESIQKVGIPVRLLPKIVETGTLAGGLCARVAERWQLPADTPVSVACGDSPAAVYSAKEAMETGCYLNLGTGGQLAVVVDAGSAGDILDVPGIDVRPFPGNKELVVTTSQCGGKAFLWLVETVEHWLEELGCTPIPRDSLFDTLTKLGLSRPDAELPDFLPYFSDERHATGLMGSISGIRENNFSIAALSRSLAIGMVAPLFDRMPREFLEGKKTVIGTGNGIRRSELVKEIITEVTGLELITPDIIEEAASGVAHLAADSLKSHS